MPLTTFYFELHQPFRLAPKRGQFLWDEKNREIFSKVAKKNYVPATRMFTDIIKKNPRFKICLSMSGVFLEQAHLYQPELIVTLQELFAAGLAHNQVEYLDETYYHSLVGLFADPDKQEFKEQVAMHTQLIRDIFGVKPTSFCHTELMYNNDIARAVDEMGYQAILCEQRADMYAPQEGKAISSNAVFRTIAGDKRRLKLIALPRNRDLSDDVAFRFPHISLTADQYAANIAKVDGEAVILGYDFEHIGEHLWENTGIFEFWKALPDALNRYPSIKIANPTEVAQIFRDSACPVVDIHPLSTSSWADAEKNTQGWLGSFIQQFIFKDIENLEPEVKKAGGSLLTEWRQLTTSDHLYYLHEGQGPDRAVHDYFSPYGSQSMATFLLTRNLDNLKIATHNFNILKQREQTPVLIITPETGKLPVESLGQFAQYVSGKSGGLGDVISALCKGLSERKIPIHLITLNLRKRFKEESHLSEAEWIESRHQINPEKIHLISSSIYEDFRSAYEGDPRVTAAEFQRQIINHAIKQIHGRYGGRAVVHSHDWMAGGVISAYCRLRKIPLLHTVHNTHTAHVPLEWLTGVNIGRLSNDLYYSKDWGKDCVDCQATALKSANLVSFVGKRFLEEVVKNYFMDRQFIPWSVRQETKIKYFNSQVRVVANGISPDVFPENQTGLPAPYGPDAEIIKAKKVNLIEFQKRLGLNVDPEAILLLWPSRLDPLQKGVELLEDIALKFVIEHGDTQIAIIGNAVGSDRSHQEILGRVACASQGKIVYHYFTEELGVLGYAAASDVFGASLYEPFGQIDVMGNIYGATATNRDTGGYADKIIPLSLKAMGAPQDRGNGFLFKNYDSGGLWWGLHRAVEFHRFFRQHPDIWEAQARRIMLEARRKWSLENMVASYIMMYEELNHNKPLC